MLSYLQSVLEYNIHQPEKQADFSTSASLMILPWNAGKHTEMMAEDRKRMKDVDSSNGSHVSRKPLDFGMMLLNSQLTVHIRS